MNRRAMTLREDLARMCFSAPASFILAATTAAIGIAALAQVREVRQIPLAIAPLLFAVQQALEGAIWVLLAAAPDSPAVAVLVRAFLIFALVLWPIVTPLAVLLIEPDHQRGQLLRVIAAVGVALAAYLLLGLLDHPPTVAIHRRSLQYKRRRRLVLVLAVVLGPAALPALHLRPAAALLAPDHPHLRRPGRGRLRGLGLCLLRDLHLGLVLLRRRQQHAALPPFQARRGAVAGTRPRAIDQAQLAPLRSGCRAPPRQRPAGDEGSLLAAAYDRAERAADRHPLRRHARPARPNLVQARLQGRRRAPRGSDPRRARIEPRAGRGQRCTGRRPLGANPAAWSGCSGILDHLQGRGRGVSRPGPCPAGRDRRRLRDQREAAVTTMAAEAIERAAALLAASRRARRRCAGLPEDCRPPDEAAAYRIQDALHARLGAAGHGALAGHKIGCTTAVMQRFLGIENPCAGGVFAPTVQHRAGRFAHAALLRPGVECEIAVRLARSLPASGAPYDAASVAPAVGACMAAIEVVDDRYEDYRSLDTPTLIADDFFSAGCVLGVPVENWREFDLAAVEGRMIINGSAVGRGRGGDILGHPLAALAWLANSLAGRGHTLQAGEFVLLGSVVQTRWVAAGDLVEIEIEGLGRASCDFV